MFMPVEKHTWKEGSEKYKSYFYFIVRLGGKMKLYSLF
jgi:hypothetical protein